MSGVFGVVDPHQKVDHANLMGRMAAAMSHREWYVADTYIDNASPVALGRLGIGIFNPCPQPVWNANCTTALFMAGEFYEVPNEGQKRAGQPDEMIALSLYEQYGEDFIRQVKGAFIIAVWDAKCNRLLLFNDRFGLYPLYYASHQGRLVFAPEVKGILCDPGFSRKLDLTALAQYMRFQHLLGVRTFFEDIYLLPDASILIYDLCTSSYQIKTYWDFNEIPYCTKVSFNEAVEESARLFELAVQRLSGDCYRPGVFLSGGYDSRAILGAVERRPIVTLTFGSQNSRDVYYAEKIARAKGSDHHWFDLPNGNWVIENADFHLELTEGLHSWIHAHGITILPDARRLIDVNLSGWDGGTLFDNGVHEANPLLISPVDDNALTTHLFHLFIRNFTWPSITEAEERLLYCEPLCKELPGLAFDSFREELSKYLDYHQDIRWKYFYFRNSCGRLTKNMITFTRSHIEVRFPFFDNDLFDFVCSLPAQLRSFKDGLFYRAVIHRVAPRMAYIPSDYDEKLLTPNSWVREPHAFMQKVKNRVNRHIFPIFQGHFTLYADYENYLRGELRDWAEDILYDQRMSDRNIFDPAFIRTLMNRHLSGFEEWTIGKIAPIMTYEMMLRRLYDC